MKRVRIKFDVAGYKAGDTLDLPDNRALTYCRSGEAEPIGWTLDGPQNRMLDTRTSRVVRTKPSGSGGGAA